MRDLHDHLSQYAAYHRDPRNIATHFVGVPMIALAVATLLSRPAVLVADLPLSPAVVVIAAFVAFYLKLDLRFGAVMALLMTGAGALGAVLAAQPTGTWLGAGVGLFVVGWVIQFVGHYWEGRKPAFVDDLVGLVVGPLFVTAEAAFLLGLRPEVRAVVEQRAGPTRARAAAPAR